MEIINTKDPNEIFIAADDFICFIYHKKENQLYIGDRSLVTNQVYLLSDNDEDFINTLEKNIEKLDDGIAYKSWTNKLEFNVSILDVTKFSEFQNTMLHTCVDGKHVILITYQHWFYDTMYSIVDALKYLVEILKKEKGCEAIND